MVRRFCDGVSRRNFLRIGALGTLGLSLPGFYHQLDAATPPRSRSGRAKACIFLYQVGAPSHFETFDPKPEAPEEVRGEFGVVGTTLPGVVFSEHVPRLASLAHKLCIVRSCSHDDPEHNSACHAHLTGRMHPQKGRIVPPSPDDFPPYGAVVSRLRPTALPVPTWVTMPNVLLNNGIPYPSQNAGFLGAAYDPLFVRGDPNQRNFRLDGLNLEEEARARLNLRTRLLGAVDRTTGLGERPAPAVMESCHERARTLLASPRTREAFTLDREPARIREQYGRHTWGQSLLLARRLVEAGVPLVSVYLSNGGQAVWDTHGNNFNALRNDLLPRFDRALAALLGDLDDRGLLDETLVVAGGEFGRTPKINGGAGRDHWPFVYSTLYAGGGIRPGTIYGSSDRIGGYPSSLPVSPGDMAATVYHCLGLDPESHIHDRLGRPFPLALGRPIQGILN